jgi:hypothetical protein
MGTLDRIDIVGKNTGKGEQFNRVFVHFRQWNDTENSCIARDRLLNGKEIKIIYDDPWFWKISAYKEPERRRPNLHYSKPIIKEKRQRQDDVKDEKEKAEDATNTKSNYKI